MADIEKTYKELRELKNQLDEAALNLKKTTNNTITNLVIRSIVAACASNVVDKLAGIFLPKSLRGPAKVAAAFGTFFIPEIIGAKAGDLAQKIMEEE